MEGTYPIWLLCSTAQSGLECVILPPQPLPKHCSMACLSFQSVLLGSWTAPRRVLWECVGQG